MLGCKLAGPTSESNHSLQVGIGELVDRQKILENDWKTHLNFTNYTLYSINSSIVGQFMHDSRDCHRQVVFFILRYL